MVVICWKQIPVYAAKFIGAFVDRYDGEVSVLRWPGDRFAATDAERYTHCRIIDKIMQKNSGINISKSR